MKTRTIKIYSYSELSDDAKEVAVSYVQNRLDSWVLDDWYYFIYEDFVREVKRQGIEIGTKHDGKVPSIYWTGFWSQGDGASFEGSVDLLEYMKFHKLGNDYRKLYNFIKSYGGGATIKQSGHYVHEYTMSVTVDLDTYDFEYGGDYSTYEVNQLATQTNELEKHLGETVISLAKDLYKDLQREWEYITSSEYIAEELTEGGYEFLESGERA